MPDIDPARLSLDAHPHQCVIEPRFQDLDPLGHINNVAMGALFEAGRIKFNHENGLADARQPGHRWLIARLAIDYLAEAHFPESVTIAHSIGHVGRSSWTIFSIAFQAGRPVAICEAVLVVRDGDRAVEMPASHRDILHQWMLKTPG